MNLGDYVLELTAAGLYLLGLPLLIYGICALHKYLLITRRERKMKRNADRKKLPSPLWPKFTRSLGFTMKKDTRPVWKLPVSHRLFYWIFYLAGLILTVVGVFIENWELAGIGCGVYFIGIMFSLNTASKVLKQRDKILDRIFKTVDFKFHYDAEGKENPSSVVKVLEWRNYVEPEMIEMEIPLSFDSMSQDEFMKHFNQHLSKMSTEAEERSWVPAVDPDKKLLGWDYGASKLTVRTVPPLPTMAPWHEGYVLNERCAWSFFPLGLGIENGVEMPNPENPEEMQSVIGVDVSGEQAKLGKKMGFPVSSNLVTSPQLLIGGGTGGGKSLSVDTLIPVVKRDR